MEGTCEIPRALQAELKRLPGIEKLLGAPRLRPWADRLIHPIRVKLARELVSELRARALRGEGCPAASEVEERLLARYERLFQSHIQPVINATGILLHTNLGRAPLGQGSLDSMARDLAGYCTLELDLETGERGSRTRNVETLLELLLDAPAGLVVNNNAAALFLSLNRLAVGREVLLSRGEMVQIGGGFRIPEVLSAAGVKLVEVGTTNITGIEDYERAIGPQTALLLKVHQSCFSVKGHVESPSLPELSALAHRAGRSLIVDLGSGLLGEEVPEELTIDRALRSGASLVCFSGDKLLGGPQAGILVGERDLIQDLAHSPLYRALRAGKTELYLLEQTLLAHAAGTATPTQRLLRRDPGEILARAQKVLSRLGDGVSGVRIIPGMSCIGGGAAPDTGLPTALLEIVLRQPERLMKNLLRARPPVIARKQNKRVLLDLRTVAPEEEDLLVQALKEALACSS